jgi:hypothetical protein
MIWSIFIYFGYFFIDNLSRNVFIYLLGCTLLLNFFIFFGISIILLFIVIKMYQLLVNSLKTLQVKNNYKNIFEIKLTKYILVLIFFFIILNFFSLTFSIQFLFGRDIFSIQFFMFQYLILGISIELIYLHIIITLTDTKQIFKIFNICKKMKKKNNFDEEYLKFDKVSDNINSDN